MKFGRNAVKKKQHKNYLDEDKKSAINKKKKMNSHNYYTMSVSIIYNMSTVANPSNTSICMKKL